MYQCFNFILLREFKSKTTETLLFFDSCYLYFFILHEMTLFEFSFPKTSGKFFLGEANDKQSSNLLIS